MDLGKNIIKPVPEPFAPLIVFITGLIFCVLIWLLTIYFMVTSEFDFLHYAICKRLASLSYLELTSFIFIGFIILGLLLLPSRRKIYSTALIASCLSIAFNTGILREIARVGHADAIQTFEHIIKTSAAHPVNMPRVKQRYGLAVDLWRELENPALQPLEAAYWSETEKANFNTNSFTCWGAIGPISNSAPAMLLFSAEGKAIGILPDGKRLFGFAGNDANCINDQEDVRFNVGTENMLYEFYAFRTNGVLDTYFSIDKAASWENGRCKYGVVTKLP